MNLNSLHSCRVAPEYGSPRSVRCLWLSAYKMTEAISLERTANLYITVSFQRILRVFLLLPRHMPVLNHEHSLERLKVDSMLFIAVSRAWYPRRGNLTLIDWKFFV